jgi:hypothetical protein
MQGARLRGACENKLTREYGPESLKLRLALGLFAFTGAIEMPISKSLDASYLKKDLLDA